MDSLHPRVLSLSQGPQLSWFSSLMETAIKAYKPKECGGGVSECVCVRVCRCVLYSCQLAKSGHGSEWPVTKRQITSNEFM